MKRALNSSLILVLVLLAGPPAAARQASDQERVAKNKETILSRLKREKVEYRGVGSGLRFKSEWVDKVVRDYAHQKLVLAAELSAGEKYALNNRWIFKDMKVTFQELFNLGPEDDEKLLPLSYGDELLNMMPGYALEGMTILGKGGEVKGPYKRSAALSGPSLAAANGANPDLLLLRATTLIFPLYVNKEGKERIALGLARDAYTVKWKDIKNRVVDDMSEATYADKLSLLRDYITVEEFKELH
ncbi:MAG TPA: hypothetical protein VGB98_12805 [Pyrinomonadaceae bacterium]|jgi:hypothetical protein